MTGEESSHESGPAAGDQTQTGGEKSIFSDKERESLTEAEQAYRKKCFESKSTKITVPILVQLVFLHLILIGPYLERMF